ncbi:MAG: ABC-type transport auxiliary lipoprotein family protein [Enterobacterales bacterium]|nr:ABC-type transport auxiliary lipoprotein family protein [Enterobacterales bacterium]
MTRILIIFSLIIFSLACANSPKQIHYYKLSSAKTLPVAQQSKKTPQEMTRPLVILKSVELANYLRRQGLMMETSAHQLQISNRNQWAEDLEGAVTRLMLNGLSAQLTEYRFEDNDRLNGDKETYQLKISLEQFHIGRDSQTITTGHFWLYDHQGKILAKQGYSLNRSLKEDGYDHAVDQLEKSLQELVDLIAMEIAKF